MSRRVRTVLGVDQRRRHKAMQDAVARLTEPAMLSGRSSSIEAMQVVRNLATAGGLRTLEPLLPLFLQLNGKPVSLKNHFPFSPIFRTHVPRKTILVAGRQLSKSTSMAARGVLWHTAIPDFTSLYVTPLYEQVRRFSNNYIRPFIDHSPLRHVMLGPLSERSVLQRSFRNASKMIFSFALLDADRVRGVSCDAINIDELQDMDPAHLSIIGEAISASDWKLTFLAGTPKSLDNPIHGNFGESSQAEWWIRCRHCRKLNIPSLDEDLEKMIGPLHDDISEQTPATICARCRKPIYPRDGRWVHRYPERRWTFAGYHVPQLIVPMHYARRYEWSQLLAKQRGQQGYTQPRFFNEVLGVSVDVGQKLISETELRAAGTLPWDNNPADPSPVMLRRLPHYRMRVLAVDWGGGGEDEVSFTTLALLGLSATGEVHCLWGKRLILSQEHLREAQEILHWMRVFNVDLVAHDYTGAGIIRETVMVAAGVPLERLVPVQYVRAASASLMQFVPPTPIHDRGYFRLDKTRSLLYMFHGLKTGAVRTFRYARRVGGADEDPGLLGDMLALVEEKTSTRLAGDLYVITRNPRLSDDFAQALNIGCAALWQSNDCWPSFSQAARRGRLAPDQERSAGSGRSGL